MSDNNDYLRTSTGSFRLTADVTTLMLKGAGYAAIFCITILFISILAVKFADLLPPESKEAVDPTPTSFLIDQMTETSDIA
jgi:hypothetical protein